MLLIAGILLILASGAISYLIGRVQRLKEDLEIERKFRRKHWNDVGDV